MDSQTIEMPAPVHCCEVRVLYGDTDSGGVVYYANYLRYFEHGRTEFMRDKLLSYKELEDKGLILPVVENYIRYKAPAVYDDLLRVETALLDVRNVSCRFNYRITRKNDSRLLVKGYTVHAAVNREGRLTRLPDDVLARLNELA